VRAQVLVAFRGNRYSVPRELAGAKMMVTHRLAAATLDVVTAGEASPAGVGHDDRHCFRLQPPRPHVGAYAAPSTAFPASPRPADVAAWLHKVRRPARPTRRAALQPTPEARRTPRAPSDPPPWPTAGRVAPRPLLAPAPRPPSNLVRHLRGVPGVGGVDRQVDARRSSKCLTAAASLTPSSAATCATFLSTMARAAPSSGAIPVGRPASRAGCGPDPHGGRGVRANQP
jgi:hypothetical protein